MTLQITYTAMALIFGLGSADKQLSKRVRIILGIVCVIAIAGLVFTRLHLPMEVIR